MNKSQVREALETINDAILELNDDDSHSEDFYWWRAVLNIFGYDSEDGEIVPERYVDGRIVGAKC